jgi:MFS superfamily sulfate permease-like transporter
MALPAQIDPSTNDGHCPAPRPRIAFNRHELAGAFGDIGTDLPLVIGMILASGLHGPSVLIAFGLAQIASGLLYGMPMPVQPLKAVAAMVIAQRLGGELIYGAGWTIGLTMLVLTLTGALSGLARLIPLAVIRGIQFGLGLNLCQVAASRYIPADAAPGYALAAASVVVILLLRRSSRLPPALVVVALGIVYALTFKVTPRALAESLGLGLPHLNLPAGRGLLQGFVLLALPQIPLSLGNSIFATDQIARDFFPEKRVTVRKIGLTYSCLNLCVPFLGGIPVCHGSGGIAGHYAFGGRTGGSVLIYGSLYLALGLCFSRGFETAVQLFPLPLLGVILFFEGWTLIKLMHGLLSQRGSLALAVAVGLAAVTLPYGYLIGMVGGMAVYYAVRGLRTAAGRS